MHSTEQSSLPHSTWNHHNKGENIEVEETRNCCISSWNYLWSFTALSFTTQEYQFPIAHTPVQQRLCEKVIMLDPIALHALLCQSSVRKRRDVFLTSMTVLYCKFHQFSYMLYSPFCKVVMLAQFRHIYWHMLRGYSWCCCHYEKETAYHSRGSKYLVLFCKTDRQSRLISWLIKTTLPILISSRSRSSICNPVYVGSGIGIRSVGRNWTATSMSILCCCSTPSRL